MNSGSRLITNVSIQRYGLLFPLPLDRLVMMKTFISYQHLTVIKIVTVMEGVLLDDALAKMVIMEFHVLLITATILSVL